LRSNYSSPTPFKIWTPALIIDNLKLFISFVAVLICIHITTGNTPPETFTALFDNN